MVRVQGAQALLHVLGHVQGFDEREDVRFPDPFLSAGELLEALVGLWVARPAEDGLDALGHHGPLGVQVALDRLLVQQQLAQPLHHGVHRDQRVGHGHADVARHRAVREVALQAADGELLREMPELGVGQPEVALGVLEVDGVHLVRHGAAAHFTGLCALPEVVHADVGPQVPAEVHQDRVHPAHGVQQGGQVVVVLDLRGELLPVHAQLLPHELVGELHPVQLRIGREVRVEVAGGAAELGGVGHLAQQPQLGVQPFHEHLQFLAQTGGAGGLAVRPGKHRDLRPFQRQSVQPVAQSDERGLVGLLHEVLDQQRQRRVVHVLRGEPEVHELLGRAQAGLLQELLQEILHGLHVVVGHLFDGLHTLRIARAQVP